MISNYNLTKMTIENNANDITVSGNITARRVEEINVHSSQDFFMHTFLERLGMKITLMQPWYGFAELQQNDSCHLAAVYETPVQKVLKQIVLLDAQLGLEL